MKLQAALMTFAAMAMQAAGPVGDGAKGREFLATQKCLTCHRVGGEGGTGGPSRSRLGGRDFTPARMAAAMWNHAPAMWSAMESAGVAPPKITTEGSADLFAYFFMSRFFEARADVQRGRRLFESKGCAGCHTLKASAGSAGAPVAAWSALNDPIELSRQMWNHAGRMNAAAKAKGVKPPRLTAAEMNDIAAYASGIAKAGEGGGRFAPASPSTGETLFEAKGCAGCHKGSNALPRPGSRLTTAELAAAMWNHSSQMQVSSEIRQEEMPRLVGYLWAKQFEQEGGDARQGASVWEAKGCGGCHGKTAPAMAHGEEASSHGMVAVLWSHGPEMLKKMKEKNLEWPRFSDREMTDLIAFVRAGR
jgi:cytochrome c551/c552